MLYTLDAHLQPLKREYLGDQDAIRKAAEAVAQQGKAK
jgi:2,3-bisphosphoglycerate-dependent phosphoglycerate mutase